MKARLNSTAASIIKTLCYADIFDYPLKTSEIVRFFIGRKTPDTEIQLVLESMVKSGVVGFERGFYFLSGKEKLVDTRLKRIQESDKKLRSAKKIIRVFSFIPTIKLIAISGSLSMKNAKREDDIDLFVVTKNNTLWFTRVLINAFLILLKSKRNRLDNYGIDKFCPNMFVTESNLSLKISDRNIFSAHEVVQLMPIVNKSFTYEDFLNQNLWVLNILPNAFRKNNIPMAGIHFSIPEFFDKPFFFLQYLYMKHKITTEKISQGAARFHPKDKTEWVKFLYRSKNKSYTKFMKLRSLENAPKTSILGSFDTPGY